MRFYLKTQPECKVPSPSEKLALQAIIEYCGKDRIKNPIYEPNADKKDISNAPDFGFEYEKPDKSIIKINLEVTAATGATIYEDPNVDKKVPLVAKKSPIQDPFKGAKESCAKLDYSWIKNGERLTAYFLTKIPSKKECGISLSQLIKALLKYLKKIYEENKIPIRNFTGEGKIESEKNPVEYRFPIFIKEKEFLFSVTKSNYPKNKEQDLPISFGPPPYDECGSDEFQAQWDIKNSIEDKTKKLSKVEGEKWLVIDNRNAFLAKDDFIKAYDYLITKKGFTHPSFTRIFVVFSTDRKVASDIIELTKDYEI